MKMKMKMNAGERGALQVWGKILITFLKHLLSPECSGKSIGKCIWNARRFFSFFIWYCHRTFNPKLYAFSQQSHAYRKSRGRSGSKNHEQWQYHGVISLGNQSRV